MVQRRIFKVGPTFNCLTRFGMMKVDRRTPTDSQSHYYDEANGNDVDHRHPRVEAARVQRKTLRREGKEQKQLRTLSQDTMGLLKPSSVLDMCYAQVQQVQMGSNVVKLNIRHIPVKSQDEVIAVGKKGINVLVSVHNFSLLVEHSVRP